jgi:uncharacterized membrane protein YhaH (DUF805 family)
MHALFGFSGRMRRRSFLLWILAIFVLTIFVGALAAVAAIAAAAGGEIDLLGPASLGVLIPLVLLLSWMQTALAVKRIHDMGRSGWFVVPFTLSMFAGAALNLAGQEAAGALVSLAYWIFLGVIAGIGPSPGDNQYGPDPRRISLRADFIASPIEEQSRAERAMEALIQDRKSFGRR